MDRVFFRWRMVAATLLVLTIAAMSAVRSEAADRVETLYSKAGARYHQLYDDPVYASQTENWLRTIKQFKIIQQTYPSHYRAPASLYNIGRLYRSLFQIKNRQIYLDRSNLAFRKLVDDYPKSTLADDAQFLLAENYEIFEKNKDLAYLEYKNLLEWFPKTEFENEAEKRIQLLRPPHKDLRIYPVEEKKAVPVELAAIRFGGLSEAEDDPERPQVEVSKIDYWATADWSRMVVNAGSDVRYSYRVLPEDANYPQKRLVLDIFHAYLPEDVQKKITVDDGLVTSARIAQFDRQTVRVVLDLVSLEKIKLFHFKLPLQFKIVIDILGQNDLSVLNDATRPDPTAESTEAALKTPEADETESGDISDDAISLSKVFGLKVKRVILDPGHGGKDPGASAFGLDEKDVTLGIAKSLREIIKHHHPQIEVLMTRKNDEYIKLEARTAFANQNKGDLFISIHVNASPRPRIRGTETYYLNLTSDNEALMLAAKENETSLKSISDLQSILNDLLTNSKIQESSDLAEKVQFAIVSQTTESDHKMRDLGVKKAPFIVLLGAQMPCILVETGFLSNKEENQFLRTEEYRRILAQGIYQGIDKYMD
ncbi:MAG: N-acetylmuramoyl-L-alanine amidase [bacterium]